MSTLSKRESRQLLNETADGLNMGASQQLVPSYPIYAKTEEPGIIENMVNKMLDYIENMLFANGERSQSAPPPAAVSCGQEMMNRRRTLTDPDKSN